MNSSRGTGKTYFLVDESFFQLIDKKEIQYFDVNTSNKYCTAINDFFQTLSTEEANDLHSLLLSLFNQNQAKYLSNEERFFILRALAKFPQEERKTIIEQSLQASMEFLSQNILEAICLLNTHQTRGSDFYKLREMPEQELALPSSELRELIAQTFLKIAERSDRVILAKYFISKPTPERKEAFARNIIEQINNEEECKIATSIPGRQLTLKGMPKKEPENSVLIPASKFSC